LGLRLTIFVAMSSLLTLGGLACGGSEPRIAVKPDIYLLLVDTLRADHLGLYGYERPTSPNLDRFADSATVFEDVVATAPWTLPSVGSVMTGTYPSAHGLRARVRVKGMTALRPGVKTLAEALAEEGYRTVSIISNPWLKAGAHGLSRGFEEVVTALSKSAAHLNELARKVVSKDDPRPLFLYVHYMDPHGPYTRYPGAKDLGPLPRAKDRELTSAEIARIPKYLRLPGVKDLGRYVHEYDIAIRAWDESFGARSSSSTVGGIMALPSTRNNSRCRGFCGCPGDRRGVYRIAS